MIRPLTILLALSLWGNTAAQASESPADARIRDVLFRNGTVELQGMLMVPRGRGPFPAVVFLHGSGVHTRAGFKRLAEEFLRLGVASLAYDKRGTGLSSGSWITSSLDDLANDAIAAVSYLKRIPEVDGKRIGFWGVSQGGWVAPLAASKHKDTGFVIVVSGGGATPRESEMFSYRQHFRQLGWSGPDSTRAVEVLNNYYDYLATGRGRNSVVAELNEIRAGNIAPLAVELEKVLPSQENQPNWSWVATYDPASHISQLRCPVLLLFGDQDVSHPPDQAIAGWREAFARAGNEEVTVVVFPGADHGIRVPSSAGGTHDGRGSSYADGYMDVQLGWLWRNVVAPETSGERP